MRVLELFGGYGSQALALENLGYDFTSDLCEIDKYAIQAYNQLHGETKNWGDICSIDETQLPHYDLITYSSPCQDFSVAGKQAGGDKGSGTRSSLLWECERIIRAVKPKYLLMENVKNLVGKKHIHNFIAWLKTLESLGYQNFWKVLNAKDYGVPQNRERVFVVSILGGGQYQFPEPIPLTKRLKDVLEQNVDEKYYLSDKLIQGFLHRQETNNNGFAKNGINVRNEKDYATSLTARMAKCGMTDNYIQEPIACSSRGRNPYNPSDRTTGIPIEQRIEINTNGTTNTITTVQKDNYVIVPEATKQGYAIAKEGDSINLDQPNSKTRRGRVGHEMANTLTCSCNQGVVEPLALDEQNGYIRKDGCVGTLTTDGNSPKHNNRVIEPKVMQEPMNLYPNSGNPQAGRVYNANGISPAMDTCSGGNRMPKITEYRFFEQAIKTAEEKDAKNGDTVDAFNQRVNNTGVCPTLTTRPEGFKTAILPVQNYRIRKLTPRECWRLMGVRDEQFDKLHDISNSQLYKMAGNSIVVDVLMGIFKNMFEPTEQIEPTLF